MKNRKEIIWALIAVCLFAIIILIVNNSSLQVKGWYEFKKTTIKSYSFVKDVNLDSITPPDIRLSFTLGRKIDIEEVDELFIRTINYIFTEEVFEDLKKHHAKKYKYSFDRISIIFSYKRNNDEFKCRIFSSSNSNGEPDHKSFDTWYIEYDNEPARLYDPGE
jgi:hypothetical protein